ncbi:MAG: hypothetical protein QG567_870 [Campylobacterota bacterium]|nr:hypothetical protein [Campylobacterota bacterium]
MFYSIKNSISNLFKKPKTIDYPNTKINGFKNHRGLIEHSHEHCIYCDKCENACPPKAILFFQNEDGSKIYNYNAHLCIFCGECVRACPKPQEALWQSEERAQFATKEEAVSKKWLQWQKDTKKSREDFAKKKNKKIE